MPSKQAANDENESGFAPAWRPDLADDPTVPSDRKSSKLEGAFTDLNEGANEYGSYPIVSITDDNGVELAWHAMSEIAKTQFIRSLPQLNHRLRIIWEGKVESKVPGRKPYTKWRVENLTLSPEAKTKTLLAKFTKDVQSQTRRPENRPPSSGDFDDEYPY